MSNNRRKIVYRKIFNVKQKQKQKKAISVNKKLIASFKIKQTQGN